MLILALGFFITALLYAAVGFGGGSTYSALLALAGTDYRVLPVLSLCCNLLVVSGGCARFARAGAMPWREGLIIASVAAPLAFLGGLTPIKEDQFLLLLGISLLAVAIFLVLPVKDRQSTAPRGRRCPIIAAAAPLGYLSGLVGIGGGIFLAPLLHLTRWDSARRIAATASLFILVNALFGLAGQLVKNGTDRFAEAASGGLPLFLAVIVGGQIGSLLALRFLPERVIRWLTAALTGSVGVQLLVGRA